MSDKQAVIINENSRILLELLPKNSTRTPGAAKFRNLDKARNFAKRKGFIELKVSEVGSYTILKVQCNCPNFGAWGENLIMTQL